MRYTLHGRIWDICYNLIIQGELEGNYITNMRLHKILYYLQGFYLVENDGKALFGEKMYAWQYGPVVEAVYHELKMFGSKRLNANRIRYSDSLSVIEKKFINEIWDLLKGYDTNRLVNMTHKAGAPWSQVYQQGRLSREIPNELLRDYFKRYLVKASNG